VPGARLGNKFFEDAAGHFALLEGSLGMPLHAENPVSLGGAFDGFDDSILRRAGDHAQRIAGGSHGLVMTGVDGEALLPGEEDEVESGATTAACWMTSVRGAPSGRACCTGDSMCWTRVPLRQTFKVCVP